MLAGSKVGSYQSWSSAPYLGAGYDPIQFSSTTDLRFYKFRKIPNPINIVRRGITFTGFCGSRNCSEYDKSVCAKLSKGGYGKFDLAKDSCDCMCPCCGKPLKSLGTCIFYRCKWEYTGMVQQPGASELEPPKKYIKKNENGVAKAKNGFFIFSGDLTSWRFLEFNVEEIPEEELVEQG